MNISEKVIDIVKGMEGIGGVPTDKEFLEEFQFRLQDLTEKLPINNVLLNEADLVSFGAYLLSEERQSRISEVNKNNVTDADIANWKAETNE
jgi:hypothetical protein